MARRSRRSSRAALLERGHHALHAYVQKGREPEDHAGRHRHDERKQQHARIDGNPARPRQTCRICAQQRLHAHAREQQAQGAASQRQHHTFGHELTQQPAAACAQSGAHGEFAMPCFGTREQQVRRDSRRRSAARTRRRPAAPRSPDRPRQESRRASASSAGCGRRLS